jgi:hypothetical protein
MNNPDRPNGRVTSPLSSTGSGDVRLPEPGGFDSHTHMDIM